MSDTKNPQEVTFEAGSLEWLEARSKNITATEVASLFGLNKYKSAKALAQDKVSPKKIWSKHIRRGRILEPAVLQAVREDLGWVVGLYGGAENVSFYQHPEIALSATPDGKILGSDGEVEALIELKTATQTRMDDWDFEVPLYYALQVHAQMMCVGVDKAYIACLGAFDPFPLIVYEIIRDEKIERLIKIFVEKFWRMFYNKIEYSVDKAEKEQMREWVRTAQKRVY